MKKVLLLSLLSLSLVQCKGVTDVLATDAAETAQQIGDVMASVDEMGGSTGALANYKPAIEKTFNRYAPGQINQSTLAQLFQPQAQATACEGYGFATCDNSTKSITRTFNGCTVGSATFTGTTKLTWGGAATTCALSALNDTITRVPSFTVDGRRNAVLTVSKTGTIGQQVKWISGTGTNKVFEFSNDGIKRAFTLNSTTLFDQTTKTLSAITVSGSTRSNRVMNGGVLQVVNNLSGVTCDYSPSNVTWTAGCNCPTSGSWSGTCSNNKSSSLTVTGCGTATYTENGVSESLTLDRCGS